MTGIIDLIEDADESAANIYENLKAAIKKAGLPLEGLTSIGADNANVNMGNNHSVYSLFHDEIENLIKAIKKKEVPLADQIQFFLSNAAEKEIHNSSTTTIRQTEVDEEVEEEPTKVIRSDQLWAMLLAINATPTPNMKKLISFLYSIPASNAYVEGIFSEMKHLLNDFHNRITSDSVAAELQIRRNGFLSCTDMLKYLLSQKELLKAISSNHKYTFKKQRVE
ncbi:unnamed protein product [Rotaria sordida]|uniref:HAT C-terminal dimerisation domain-containing protein n=1 Tax=Rotaria sordida TaxID=392033 RepID=A0A815UB44_9BILA|nr:unnamed protein product [Rotaria sordida]